MNHGKFEEPPEVFRGTLDECLRHLGAALEANHPAGSKGAASARQPLADFCGVGWPTATRWLKGELPVGLPLIKAICYLQLFGYRVVDFNRVKPGRRHFAELIAFGLLNPEEAAALVGYSDPSWLYAVLKGGQGASDAKEAIMSDTWLARRSELDAKKIQAKERYKLDIRFKTRASGEAIAVAALSSVECLLALFEAGAIERIVEKVGDNDRVRVVGLVEDLGRRLSELAISLSGHPDNLKGE
jgi:hypothetical protein